MMLGHTIEETTTNLSRIGIPVGQIQLAQRHHCQSPWKGLANAIEARLSLCFFPSPLYFEQEEDGATEIHNTPLVEDSFSFLLLHAWVELQRTGGRRRVGIGELHFEDTSSLWKRAREGRDIPTGMGEGILAPRCYWSSGVDQPGRKGFAVGIPYS